MKNLIKDNDTFYKYQKTDQFYFSIFLFFVNIFILLIKLILKQKKKRIKNHEITKRLLILDFIYFKYRFIENVDFNFTRFKD